jgi:pyruvate dehydrogenase E2 component (dihydrolipoamide acetyltransferase)
MAIEFRLPELGEDIEAPEVVNVLVSEGDEVRGEQIILELETEKAVVELPCPHDGRISKLHVKRGDRLASGQLVATIDGDLKTSSAPAPPDQKSQAPAPTQPEPVQEIEKPTPAAPTSERVEDDTEVQEPIPAGPATRRLARELGVDLRRVSGSGTGGRITEQDLRNYVRERLAAIDAGTEAGVDGSSLVQEERVPLTGVRRKMAERMADAWAAVPHVTQFDNADITELDAMRRARQKNATEDAPRITPTAFLLRASVRALKEFPQFNSSIDLETNELIVKKVYHIGVAVDTEHGLVVPVVRNADRKTLVQLAEELADLSEKARTRKLGVEQMRHATFTITNLGAVGGTAFTPIVDYPQVAILGAARGQQQQVIMDNEPRIRLMLPLCLSYDHRVIDGASGARFTRRIAQMLSNPVELM